MRHLVVWIILFLLISAGSVHAKGAELESTNIVFAGTIKQKQAETLIYDLEIYRASILNILQTSSRPETVKVKILAVKDADEFEDITGYKNFGGYYGSRPDGPYFILNAKNGFKKGDRARHIAIHEFTHHLLQTYHAERLPRWYEEGYAEYLANFERDGDQIIIGQPNRMHSEALTSNSWLDWKIIFGSIDNYPFSNDGTQKKGITNQDRFYAQSWLAVHYIQNMDAGSEKLNKYIRNMNMNPIPANAFEDAFGVTDEAFGTLLEGYNKTNKYKYFKIDDMDFSQITKPVSRPLSETSYSKYKNEFTRIFKIDASTVAERQQKHQAAYEAMVEQAVSNQIYGKHSASETDYQSSIAYAKALINDLSWDNAADIQKVYNRLSRDYGDNAEILTGKAKIQLTMSNLDAARTLAENALKLDAAHNEARLIAGKAIMLQHNYVSVAETEIRAAQSHLASYLTTGNDTDAHFFYLLATAELSVDMAPREKSAKSINACLQSYSGTYKPERMLALAGWLAQMEEHTQALELTGKILATSQDPELMAQARQLQSQITEYIAYNARYQRLYGK